MKLTYEEGAADYEAMVANLLATYRSASEDQKTIGRDWYSTQREMIRVLASESGFETNIVAAVVALLSPRVHWAQNLSDAARMLHAAREGAECPTRIASYPCQVAKAWRVLQGEAPELVIDANTSPKVAAFYQNLCGQELAVTVDVWMARACGTPQPKRGITPVAYRRYVSAICAAAGQVVEVPAQFQAICWVVVRGRED